MTDYRSHFESFGEYLAFAKSPKIQNDNTSSRRVASSEDSWEGSRTFEEAFDWAEHGWTKGRELLMQAVAEAESSPYMTPALKDRKSVV